jgi:Toastrack DUF4097
MKKYNHLLFVAVLVVSHVVTAQEVSRSFSGVKKIRLNTASGDMQLKRGSGEAVEVKLEYTYPADEFKPIMEQHGSTLILKEDFARGSHTGNSNWTLTVPDHLDIDVNTGSGNLKANGIDLTIRTNLGSGDVDLGNMKGDINLNTGSGNAHIHSFEGRLDANTGSGNIELVSSGGEIKLNAGSGGMKVTAFRGALSANVGSGNIKAEKLVLMDEGLFNSGSGNVSVQLEASPDHNISVNSGSGNATLDFNGSKFEGTIIMTANKRGGKIVAPFTFDKTEEINDEGSNVRVRKTAKLGASDIVVKVGTGSGTAKVIN